MIQIDKIYHTNASHIVSAKISPGVLEYLLVLLRPSFFENLCKGWYRIFLIRPCHPKVSDTKAKDHPTIPFRNGFELKNILKSIGGCHGEVDGHHKKHERDDVERDIRVPSFPVRWTNRNDQCRENQLIAYEKEKHRVFVGQNQNITKFGLEFGSCIPSLLLHEEIDKELEREFDQRLSNERGKHCFG